MNERKLFIIDPRVLGVAKSIYKGGAYVNASNSAFLRGLLEDVKNGIKNAKIFLNLNFVVSIEEVFQFTSVENKTYYVNTVTGLSYEIDRKTFDLIAKFLE